MVSKTKFAILGEDTFLSQYMQHMQDLETPFYYDLWCGLWILGNAVGRHAYVDRPRMPVHLNWYIILVGESGIVRKSTSVATARKLLQAFNECTDEHDRFISIQTKITPMMLEYALHEHTKANEQSHCVICASELVTIMGREGYLKGVPGLLTDLYDYTAVRSGGGTLERGYNRAEHVYVSLLSASTPRWLIKAVNPDVVEGGFTSRCMFIYESTRKKRIPWPSTDAKLGDRSSQMLRLLCGIRQRANEVQGIPMQPAARKYFDNWYRRRRESLDPFRSSFESREDDHVLRAAACLAINDGAWAIGHKHVTFAVDLIHRAKEGGASIFEGALSSSKVVGGVDKLRTMLISAGTSGLTQTRLAVGCQHYLNGEALRTALEIMLELGMVQKFEGVRIGRGRPKNIWRATRLIHEPAALDDVLAELEPE